MPRQVTLTVYSLDEMREKFPDAYKKIHERWEDHVNSIGCLSRDEIIESMEEVVKACHAKVDDYRDYRLDPYCQGYINIDCDNEDDSVDPPVKKDAEWMKREVLSKFGYLDEAGNAIFPGNCAFTGACWDDDLLQAVYKRLVSGSSMKDALRLLAGDITDLLEQEIEGQKEEESMLENWDHMYFYSNGKEFSKDQED